MSFLTEVEMLRLPGRSFDSSGFFPPVHRGPAWAAADPPRLRKSAINHPALHKQTLTQTRTRAHPRAALLTSVFLNFAFRLFMFGPVHAVLHTVKPVKTKDFTVQPRRCSLLFQCNWM